MKTSPIDRHAIRPVLRVAMCAALLLAAPFLIDRNALEFALLHAIASTPVVALIGGVA
jgi:hypothetical protein